MFHEKFRTEISRRAGTLRRRLGSFANLDASSGQPPAASLASYELGPLVVVHFTSDAKLVRTWKVQRGSFGKYSLVLLLLRGNLHGFLDGRAFRLEVGDICAVDLSRHAELQTSGCEVAGVLVRRDEICNGSLELHGRTLPYGKLRCRMLTAHMEHLLALLPDARVPNCETLADATVAVLRSCLQVMPLKTEPPRPWVDRLRHHIVAYIEDHLTEANLDADRIRHTFQISRAHLYRLFPEYGGIQRHICSRRLDLALRMLREQPYLRISWVAKCSGFASERQFQRAFLKRFEMTPSEMRRMHHYQAAHGLLSRTGRHDGP
jgi:AraC-like DNA-binding protein